MSINENFTLQVCVSGVKKWRDLIILVQNRMAEIKDTERSNAEYEEIFDRRFHKLIRKPVLIII